MSKIRLLATACAIVLLAAAEGLAQPNASKNQPGGPKPRVTAPRDQPSSAQRTARARCMNIADPNARNRCLNGLSSTPPPAAPQ